MRRHVKLEFKIQLYDDAEVTGSKLLEDMQTLIKSVCGEGTTGRVAFTQKNPRNGRKRSDGMLQILHQVDTKVQSVSV